MMVEFGTDRNVSHTDRTDIKPVQTLAIRFGQYALPHGEIIVDKSRLKVKRLGVQSRWGYSPTLYRHQWQWAPW